MPKVIVNSTPIIVLCGIGRLDVLQKLYGEIRIPLAVYQEVTAIEDSACRQIRNAGSWIHVDRLDREQYLGDQFQDGSVRLRRVPVCPGAARGNPGGEPGKTQGK